MLSGHLYGPGQVALELGLGREGVAAVPAVKLGEVLVVGHRRGVNVRHGLKQEWITISISITTFIIFRYPVPVRKVQRDVLRDVVLHPQVHEHVGGAVGAAVALQAAIQGEGARDSRCARGTRQQAV